MRTLEIVSGDQRHVVVSDRICRVDCVSKRFVEPELERETRKSFGEPELDSVNDLIDVGERARIS
jgi:hypothetical protein